MFINLKDGQVTQNTYRFTSAVACDLDDIYQAIVTNSGGVLTASVSEDDSELVNDILRMGGN